MGDDSGTADLRLDPVFIGRSALLSELVRSLRRGRHTLLVGPKGIGKTRLMKEAAAVFSGKPLSPDRSLSMPQLVRGALPLRFIPGQYKVMFISNAAPLGDCLKEMAEKLHGGASLMLDPSGLAQGDWSAVKKRLPALGSVGLQGAIVESLCRSRPGWLIFFDSFDRITPSNQQFLEHLLESAVLCGAAVRLKDAYHFKKIWSSFTRLELGPLSEEESSQLVEYFLKKYPIDVSDRMLYRHEILKSACGNPFHIRNLLWMGSREAHVSREEIRKLRRTEEGELFNMGPVYILAASILTLSKIFSFGTDNREFYIYFSALGFLVYLIFRVYRTFFLFRPQRQ